MTDEELMARYIDGDNTAFEMLYQKHSGRAYAFLRKKLQSSQEVEEVFQNSFLKFHNSRRQYNSKYPVLQWLFVIVRSTLIDHYRKSYRQVNVVDIPVEGFSELLSKNTITSTLSIKRTDTLLEKLSKEQRDMVTRRIMDEQTYEEIALSLNRSESSIRQAVSRALRKMKTSLNPKERTNS